MQRLRVTFGRGEAIKYISHLDLMRLWERALRRAEIPLAYSEGFTPHPHLCLAAPLPVGVTSEGELLDVYLERQWPMAAFFKKLNPQLPPGIGLGRVEEVSLWQPSLQSLVRAAEYRVEVETERKPEAVLDAVRALLATSELPWQHQRDTGVRRYDLRALIQDLWVIGWSDSLCQLGMRLRTDNSASGRPEQIAAALGFDLPLRSIHRTKLLLVGR